MLNKTINNKNYQDLMEHNTTQFITFLIITGLTITIIFHLFIPSFENFFTTILRAKVHNINGESYSYDINAHTLDRVVSYYTAWAVDVNVKTDNQIRYWFNPLMALSLISMIFGVMVSVVFTTLLSPKIGLMRQKVDREIYHLLHKILVSRYGFFDESDIQEIIDEIKSSDISNIRFSREEWGISLDDLKVLQRALKWIEMPLIKRIFYVNDGVSMYMRFHFTLKYSNIVLGLVYMGAAVLIIIVGLRGLKFIPVTQPSLVLFALGLEFTLLLTYAFTIMYGKQDEEFERSSNTGESSLINSGTMGSSKDIENLLRVFIKSSEKK